MGCICNGYEVTIVEPGGRERTVTIRRKAQEDTWPRAQRQLLRWRQWSIFHPDIALALQLALARHQTSLLELGIERKPLHHLPKWRKRSAAILKQYPVHSVPLLLHFRQLLPQVTSAYLAPKPPLTRVSVRISADIHASHASISLRLCLTQGGPTVWLGAVADSTTSATHTRETISGFQESSTETQVPSSVKEERLGMEEVLSGLVENIPSLLQQLSKLNDKIQQRQRSRQLEFAQSTEIQATPNHHTFHTTTVYYDGDTLSFLRELLKFTEASRIKMAKAERAAKWARLKQLADLEVLDDSDTNENEKAGGHPEPSMPVPVVARIVPSAVATKTRMPPSEPTKSAVTAAPPSGPLVANNTPLETGIGADVYKKLCDCLEVVETMCHCASHQFLRDGDCAEEVAQIRRHLGNIEQLAGKERERKKEDTNSFFVRRRSGTRPNVLLEVA